MTQPITRDLEALLLSQEAATRYVRDQQVPTQLGYRWFDHRTLESRRCVANVGMFSRSRGSGEVWHKESIHKHCNEVRGQFSSPYMSFSISPARMLRFMVGSRDDDNAEIAIIDLRVLWDMRRPFESTTELAQVHKLRPCLPEEGRTKYVTDTHYLVHEFIPACAILGFIKAGNFQAVCQDNAITKDNDPDFVKRLNWTALKPFASRTSAFGVDARFSEEVAPPATPSAVPGFPNTPPPSFNHPAPHYQPTPPGSSTVKTESPVSIKRRQRSESPTPQPRNRGRERPVVIDLTINTVRSSPTSQQQLLSAGPSSPNTKHEHANQQRPQDQPVKPELESSSPGIYQFGGSQETLRRSPPRSSGSRNPPSSPQPQRRKDHIATRKLHDSPVKLENIKTEIVLLD